MIQLRLLLPLFYLPLASLCLQAHMPGRWGDQGNGTYVNPVLPGDFSVDTLEIRIYAGADGHFNLYSDEGDNYNYEKGNYVLVPFQWNEQKQTLTIGKRQGKYPGALQQYVFNIVMVKESQGHGIKVSPATKIVIYKGEKTRVVVK